MVQAVLVYGSEMWILTPQMVRTLRVFCYRVAHQIMGWTPHKKSEGGRFYLPLEVSIQEAGL